MKRVERLQKLMKDLDCILVTSPEDVHYYSGYRPLDGETAMLVILQKGARLFVTQNGFENKKASVKMTVMEKPGDFYDFIKNYKAVGFDEDHLLSRSYLKLKKQGLRLKPFSTGIKEPRAVKDQDEIGFIRKAVTATKKAFDIRISNRSEIEAAAEIDCCFRKLGVENAFESIVASGTNSSNVHHRPGKRKLGKGDLVIIDIGSKVNGYCSDMTRTFCSSSGKRERQIMEKVRNIQEQLIDLIKPGMKMSDVQKEYERLMGKHKAFHLFGHGVGLEVHESPLKDDTLKENMVITVEPGIYVKNYGGCRIEDMIIIKKGKNVKI